MAVKNIAGTDTPRFTISAANLDMIFWLSFM